MKVAVYSTKKYERVYLKKANSGVHELIFIEEALSADTASLAEGCRAVAIFTNDDASAEVLLQLSRHHVKHIVTRASGHDNINLKVADDLLMHVANVPEYSPYAIAEHTIAIILALNRKLIQANRQVKAYDFSLDKLIGFDLHGKTVGIIGSGRIGGIVAKILHGFGCNLLAYDVHQDQRLIADYNLRYVSIDELCVLSDIITLHPPLNEHTTHIIKEENIALMKNSVMIVNTGRGGLIKTEDAIRALDEGKIAYLGLDVYEHEKGLFFYDHSREIPKDKMFAKLLTFENVLITGHQAFLTETALTNIADTTIYNLNCFEKGERSRNELWHSICRNCDNKTDLCH